MRWLFLSAVLFGCSSNDLSHTCPNPVVTGNPTACVLAAQCKSTNVGVKLDCTEAGNDCVCSENGVVGKRVPFQQSFCGDANDAVEAANSACDWKL